MFVLSFHLHICCMYVMKCPAESVKATEDTGKQNALMQCERVCMHAVQDGTGSDCLRDNPRRAIRLQCRHLVTRSAMFFLLLINSFCTLVTMVLIFPYTSQTKQLFSTARWIHLRHFSLRRHPACLNYFSLVVGFFSDCRTDSWFFSVFLFLY